jgi:hypothetical protein
MKRCFLTGLFRKYTSVHLQLFDRQPQRGHLITGQGNALVNRTSEIQALKGRNQPQSNIADRLYGPSYVSFEYALCEYGMIPEHVEMIPSASFGKNKNRVINTSIGTFTCKRIYPKVYPYSIIWRFDNGMPSLFASRGAVQD